VIALIDTEGSIKKLPSFLYPEATVLITEQALHLLQMNLPMVNFFKQSDASILEEILSPFAASDSFDFVGQDWLESSHLEIMAKISSITIYFSLVMVAFGLCFAMLFSFSLFGQFVARFVFKVKLSFKETARLVVISATPEIAVYFILIAFNQIYFGTGVFYLVFFAVFFSLGVLAYRQDNRAMVLQ
jgi:hypothetical protein